MTNCRSAELIEVIVVEIHEGKGIEKDPYRIVIQYWSKKGFLLAENDPYKEGKDD